MTKPYIELLSKPEIESIHAASLKVLKDVGVVVTNPKILEILAEAGAIIDKGKRIARFDDSMVMRALDSTEKKYILHGRNPERVARYGYGD
jgi:trimethylamine--corrinoid protein Co-methyltransferase